MRVREILELAEKGKKAHLPWLKNRNIIECYDRNTELLLGEYNSMTEAAEDLELSVASVSLCISGKRNHVGDYIFKKKSLD